MGSRTYVIGAGLAGLSAAVRLAGRGRPVVLIEGAGHAGGRCRSYVDATLGMTIDNGNHLVLSGNHATHDFLRTLGTADRLTGPKDAVFDFCDVRDGRRWTIRPNPGPIGWWVLSDRRRVPGTHAGDYLPLVKLLAPQGDNLCVVGRAFVAAIVAVVVARAVAIAFAIGLIVLLVVAEQIRQREAVMHGDVIDAGALGAAVVIEQVG